MQASTVYFDLDGPILDVSERYYHVYATLLRDYGLQPIAKDQYWDLKRKKVPEKQILAISSAEHEHARYASARKALIETPQLRALDKLQPGALEALGSLQARYPLVLVTLRSSRSDLDHQLQHLDILRFFQLVLSSGEEREPRWRIKTDLIQPTASPGGPRGYFIGDTETDILAGRHFGLPTVAVENGIRTRELLQSFSPTWLIEGISKVTQLPI